MSSFPAFPGGPQSPLEQYEEAYGASCIASIEARAKHEELCLDMIRNLVPLFFPTAVALLLDDSDQEGMTFVIAGVLLADGTEVEADDDEFEGRFDDLTNALWAPVSDLSDGAADWLNGHGQCVEMKTA